MGDQGRWFKLWITASTDPHLGNLSLEDFARWCLFGVYMKVHGTDGIVTLDPPAVALQQIFRVDTFDAVLMTLHKFPHCVLHPVTNSPVTHRVEWQNWRKYQGDYSTDRVARWRKEKRDRVTAKKRGEEKRREVVPVVSSSEVNTKTPLGVPTARRAVLTDAEFLAQLRISPAYKGLDVDLQLAKLDNWLLTPRGRGKKKTRGRIVNWLNRALEELPLAAAAEEPYGFER